MEVVFTVTSHVDSGYLPALPKEFFAIRMSIIIPWRYRQVFNGYDICGCGHNMPTPRGTTAAPAVSA